MSYRCFPFSFFLAFLVLCSGPLAFAQPESGLRFVFEEQSRFEYEVEDRPGDSRQSGHLLALRTSLRVDYDRENIGATFEVMDSRVEAVDDALVLGDAFVDPLDILQASIRFRPPALEGASFDVGRFTQDIGSRRFMARNRFRNTINAFDGVNARMTMSEDSSMRVFYSWPVERRYDGEATDNKPEMNRSHSNQQFSGIVYSGKLPLEGQGEIYLFMLNEDDSASFQTRNRKLYSVGLRHFRAGRTGQFDHEFELLGQFGTSRASAEVTDTVTLDHRAWYLHLGGGYTFEHPWSPRISLFYDYASGDRDADDTENNNLDTLYGVPRPDFGPTGLYGLFGHSNLSSPGIALDIDPVGNTSLMLKYRYLDKASVNAPYPRAGIFGVPADPSRHLGQQLEVRARWQVLPEVLQLEWGAAAVDAGEAMLDADIGDTLYSYLQALVKF